MKKPKIRVAYKVTTRGLSSCMIRSEHFRVQYELNKWVKPRVEGTKLLVFSTLEAARDFHNSNWRTKIFKCRVKNAKPQLTLCPYYDVIFFESFWNENKKSVLTFTSPSKTLSCDEVMLLEEV